MDARVSFFLSLTLLSLCILLPTPTSLAMAKSVRCHKQDYTALKKIKAALNNPEKLDSSSPDCCNWLWTVCHHKTYRIVTIYVFDSNITGHIAPELGDLTYLESILFENLTNLTGNFPSTITKLKHLKMIYLRQNKLSGPIPSFLSQLPSLQYLELGSNQFTGSIPSSLGNHRKLGFLGLAHNRLTGEIPESFGNFGNSERSFLDLSHNNLHGEIPKSLETVDFGTIDLSGNKLVGDASMLFKANGNGSTDTLNLSNNMLEFDLSNVKFSSNLQIFDISHNRIFGSIPEAITGLYLLKLNVSYNLLSEKIPQGGKVQSFDSYNFYHNKGLCGSPLAACK